MGDDVMAARDPKDATTFPQLIRAAAAAYGDALAITLKGDSIPDDSATFVELDSRSAALAKGLLARGVGKGTRVGFIHGNGPAFAVSLAAIARIGAIAIPISTLLKADELVRVIRQSDVAGLIVQRRLLGNDYIERLCDALPALRTGDSTDLRIARTPYLRWVASTGDGLPTTVCALDAMIAAGDTVSDEMLVEVEAEVHPTDQMVEIYTSGSMALPKGVKHDHGPAMYRTHYLRAMTGPQRGQTRPAPMPMFWVGGMIMYLLPHWEVGATTACTEGTSTNSRMAMGSVLADEDLKAMPKMQTIWSLGMTETFGPYSYADTMRVEGYPLCAPLDHIADRYEVRLVGEDGRQVGEGETGEIVVRGYALTPGLHKVERSVYFDDDGFYRTGDMGVRDGTRINFSGRNGDIIKTASSNVSPAEVELELQRIEGVHTAYVLGVPDKERGQLVVAAIVPREGAELDFDAIQAELKSKLSSFKVPRRYVRIAREDIPMLASNKVSRRQLEQMLTERLAG